MTTTSEGSPKRVLVLGASRGLGLAIVENYLKRGWNVTGTVRGGGHTKLHGLREQWPAQLEIETVDITIPDEVAALHARLLGRRQDVVLVNAGVSNDRESVADASTDEFARVMVTNALSPLRAIEAFNDLVTPDGTIAIMSSGQGSVTNNLGGGYEVYRASKAAVNTLMRSFAARHASEGRTLLLLAPGWVQTDMGGPDARLTIDESIPRLVDTIEAQRGKPGLQYLDYLGRAVPW
jgi:NAD(P)-dependent dehydrogenase (short-subunit alcohol dehydrogenase family)